MQQIALEDGLRFEASQSSTVVSHDVPSQNNACFENVEGRIAR